MDATPKTLLQHAGAPLHPGSLDNAALVLIDCQLENVEGRLPLAGIGDAIAQARTLLDMARRAGTPVFHIVHHGASGGAVFDPDGRYVAIVPELTPLDGENVIIKNRPNSFAGTDLHERIAATGRGELILAGFMTHMCINATTRAASDLGYRNTIVAGATATRDLPDPLGGIVPAEALHRNSLAALADYFAIVVPSPAALAS